VGEGWEGGKCSCSLRKFFAPSAVKKGFLPKFF